MLGNFKEWNDFTEGEWQESINVQNFIHLNCRPYLGDESFLWGRRRELKRFMQNCRLCLTKSVKRAECLMWTRIPFLLLRAMLRAILIKENELIVGYQTDAPLKRGVNPFGGIRMSRSACEAYGYKLGDKIEEEFKYKTTHNDGVFRAYTKEMRDARKAKIITGLPDAYGRGRIIGDYRRVALYGVDVLIAEKNKDKDGLQNATMDFEKITLAAELYQQIIFLGELKKMAASYGYDISRPAADAREAFQWVYFAYLGAIKEQNGAAMSLGRVSTFLDIFIERDMDRGILDEEGAQELTDHFVMKLRTARHLRTPEYNELFGGDPMWITESLGGMRANGKTLLLKAATGF